MYKILNRIFVSRITCLVLLTLFTATLSLGVSVAHADTKKDLEVISKALSFVTGGPSGKVKMAIVYDPNNKRSSDHANEIKGELLTGNLAKSSIFLVGKKTSINKVTGNEADVYFITRGLGTKAITVFSKARKLNKMTFSNDEECLDKMACVLAVTTDPSVNIYVNFMAAEASGIEFASAFSMTVTKR